MALDAQTIDRYLSENLALHQALGISCDQASTLHATPIGNGEHNANFVFEHPGSGVRFVLRANYSSQLGLDDQIGYEYDALKLLEPSGCTPLVFYVDRAKSLEGHGALVMEFCEGEHLDFGVEADVAQAARMLADVHAVDPHAGHAPCRLIRPGDPLCEQFEECVGYVRLYRSSALCEDAVDRRLERMLVRAQEMLDAAFRESDADHILNTEAVPSHFLISAGKTSGRFLDWEKPILGEVAQDVAYFLSPTTTIWDTDFIFDMDQRYDFVEMYWKAVDGRFEKGGFDHRFEAYVVMNCLRGFTWSCNAWVEYHNPDRPLRNDKTLRKLGTYLDVGFMDMVFDRHFM